MKILLAPDSFKGSLSSLRVAQIMKSAIVEVMPDANVTLFPLADGGEGSLEALHEACGGTKVSVDSVDPLGRSFQGHYLLGPDGTALVELAVSSGLTILKDLDRDPGKTSSLGTGLEVLHAIESGAHSIILCVGGSATNDAGLGIAHALGFRFLDAAGNSLQPVGANLSKITGIRKPHLPKVTWKILCDVDNPFYGPAGAVHTYAAQKGASREDVTMLESGMRHFASVLQQFGYPDISQVPGAGAAGGIAGGLHALLGAELISGIQFITEQLDLARHMQDADLVLTGEGFLDDQTLQGKVIRGVVESASINKVPVIALCGGVGLDVASLDELGLTAAYGIQPSCRTIAEALTHAEDDLFLTTYQVMKTVALS